MTCVEKIRELCARAAVADDTELELVVIQLQAAIRFWKDLQEEQAKRSMLRAA